ncbi:MAG: hypothetical protein MJ101_03760 [Clostridia bacterium]|nr:hypothetical protein [Clostridia bacterium]
MITEVQIKSAAETLRAYRQAKEPLDRRIIDEEDWWRLRHWDNYRNKTGKNEVMPTSAWTFNSVINKHADMMDVVPSAVVLPRESRDKAEAEKLTGILPVVLSRNDFEKVYSDNAWYKLKHGVSAYGVFWDNSISGIGDISIKNIDVLNIFWQPGICDIQDSKNLFIVALTDNDELNEQYPETVGNLGKSFADVSEYHLNVAEDTSEKSLVVEWYYKKNGRVHLCKFVDDIILFASENLPEYRDRGFYDHGLYPVVLDVMYPEAGTCYGFGVISVCRDPQMYIDRLDGAVLENLKWQTRPRWFAKKNCGINTDDYSDLDRDIVWVEGDISDERLRQITTADVSELVFRWKESKINELKETSSILIRPPPRTTSGATSGLARSTLQEAGNKTVRDITSGSYRAFSHIVTMAIELIRQFYSEGRTFRIIGSDGMTQEYITYDNSALICGGDCLTEPVFDLDISAEKRSPYSRATANETAMELYKLGFFDPENAQKAMIALDIMDFDGVDEVKRRVQNGNTLKNELDALNKTVADLRAAIDELIRQRDAVPYVTEAQI